MEKLKKIEIEKEDIEKPEYPESYLLGVYNGKIDNNDEMYKKLLALLRRECEEIEYQIDTSEIANEIFKRIVDEVKEENNIDLSFESIENFEEDFISNINKIMELKVEERIKALDSITNMDFMHNPTTSIMEQIRIHIASKYSETDFLTNIEMLYEQDKHQVEAFEDSIFSIFGDEKKKLSDKEKSKRIESLEFYLTLPELSKIFKIYLTYAKQIQQIRETFIIEEMNANPEYIKQLQEFMANKSPNIQYWYHGVPSVEIASKITKEGLFMKYGYIDRTAKCELTIPQILQYAYGHDQVGRHAIVIIAVPRGEGIVKPNDRDILITGTSQGLEQGDFKPQYIIPSEYVVGYIDKDKKEIVKNSKCILNIQKNINGNQLTTADIGKQIIQEIENTFAEDETEKQQKIQKREIAKMQEKNGNKQEQARE